MIVELIFCARKIFVLLSITAFNRYDEFAGRHELLRHFHRRGQKPAGIVAKVEHHSGQFLFLELFERLTQVFTALLLELSQADVGNRILDRPGAHTLDSNGVPDQRKLQRILSSLPLNREIHLGALGPAHFLNGFH